jgi:hypothetical protein
MHQHYQISNLIEILLKFFTAFNFGSNMRKRRKILEEFANDRTILPNFSSFYVFAYTLLDLQTIQDHVPCMTEMVQPLRKLIPLKAYKLVWTLEAIAAFLYCQQAISNCQKLFFLEDTATTILQTDASDYATSS